MLVVCSLLILTGCLLYYAGNEIAREVSSHIHLTLGLALPLLLGFHLIKAKGVRA
jgi:hypothetical protein